MQRFLFSFFLLCSPAFAAEPVSILQYVDPDYHSQADFDSGMGMRGRFMSPDGKTVLFSTLDSKGASQIYLFDRTTRTAKNISELSPSGGSDRSYFRPVFSADGKQVVFSSRPLVPDYGRDNGMLIRYDMAEGKTDYVAYDVWGRPVIGWARDLSADPSRLAFTGLSRTLRQLFLVDLETRKIQMLTKPLGGGDPGVDTSGTVSLSRDGKTAVFTSFACLTSDPCIPGATQKLYAKKVDEGKMWFKREHIANTRLSIVSPNGKYWITVLNIGGKLWLERIRFKTGKTDRVELKGYSYRWQMQSSFDLVASDKGSRVYLTPFHDGDGTPAQAYKSVIEVDFAKGTIRSLSDKASVLAKPICKMQLIDRDRTLAFACREPIGQSAFVLKAYYALEL
jgi:hypothetical protein